MASAPRFPPFITQPPTIEIAGGIVFIRYISGDEKVMPLAAFARTHDRCKRALDRHTAGDAHVFVDD